MFETLKKNILILKKLLPYLVNKDKKFKERLFLAILFIFTAMLLNLSLPLTLKYIITQLGEQISPYYDIVLILICYGTVWTLSKVMLSLRDLCMFRVMERGIRRLSFRLMQHLNQLPMSFHTGRKTGAITNTLERARYAFPTVFWGLIFFLVPIVIEIFAAGIIFFKLYGFLYAGVLFFSTSGFLLFSIFGTQRALKQRQAGNQAELDVNSQMVETLINFETIRYFGTSNHELNRCHNLLLNREKLLTKGLELLELVNIGQNIIIGLGFTVLTWMVGADIIAGKLGLGDFVLVNAYLLQFFFPLSSFGMLFRDFHTALTDMGHAFEILDTPLNENFSLKKIPVIKKQNSITFKNVIFGYSESRTILNKVSFTAPAGKTVAIVGLTGEGKSTIPKLLYRLYDLKGGSIYLGSHNIKDFDTTELTRIIGIVPQETTLFNDTIGYNIAYGNPSASQKKIEEATEASQLLNFIESLPDKYETIVGERGVKLSGGEKQRVAIARLFLKKPQILIFDEPTSSLDTKSTNYLHESIKKLTKNKTTLIISHKLISLTNADEILVLHSGRIVEKGTHDALIKNNGYYSKLWHEQMKAA